MSSIIGAMVFGAIWGGLCYGVWWLLFRNRPPARNLSKRELEDYQG